MVQLSQRQRTEILMMIGFGDRRRTQLEVCNLFNQRYPNRIPLTQSAVSKVLKKFNNIGSVKNAPRTGRPKSATNDDSTLNILLRLEENPQTSTTQLALNENLSRRSVGRILKKEKLFPYKVHLVQELSEDDFDRRLEFCEEMAQICNRDDNFAQNICFSDEATFCLNGTVNRHNCRIWSRENPHWIQEAHTQHPQKINVWAGIFRGSIIGPFFIDGTLNGLKYLELLRNDVIPALRNGEEEVSENVWFQQDDPPHYAIIVREYLNVTFPDRWIGRRGAIEWPARSPDLSPLDFFSGGT